MSGEGRRVTSWDAPSARARRNRRPLVITPRVEEPTTDEMIVAVHVRLDAMADELAEIHAGVEDLGDTLAQVLALLTPPSPST